MLCCERRPGPRAWCGRRGWSATRRPRWGSTSPCSTGNGSLSAGITGLSCVRQSGDAEMPLCKMFPIAAFYLQSLPPAGAATLSSCQYRIRGLCAVQRRRQLRPSRHLRHQQHNWEERAGPHQRPRCLPLPRVQGMHSLNSRVIFSFFRFKFIYIKSMLFLYRNDDTMMLLDCKVGTVDNSYSCFQNLENFSNSVIHFICSHFAEEKKVEINKFSVGTWIIGRFTF